MLLWDQIAWPWTPSCRWCPGLDFTVIFTCVINFKYASMFSLLCLGSKTTTYLEHFQWVIPCIQRPLPALLEHFLMHQWVIPCIHRPLYLPYLMHQWVIPCVQRPLLALLEHFLMYQWVIATMCSKTTCHSKPVWSKLNMHCTNTAFLSWYCMAQKIWVIYEEVEQHTI